MQSAVTGNKSEEYLAFFQVKILNKVNLVTRLCQYYYYLSSFGWVSDN